MAAIMSNSRLTCRVRDIFLSNLQRAIGSAAGRETYYAKYFYARKPKKHLARLKSRSKTVRTINIDDCRLPIADWSLASLSIGIRQWTIWNAETHPLPRVCENSDRCGVRSVPPRGSGWVRSCRQLNRVIDIVNADSVPTRYPRGGTDCLGPPVEIG